MKSDFNKFRFEGLNYRDKSNKYLTMNRVNDAEDKIVVKVNDEHLLKTTYGYALILNAENVVFIKDWQVDSNFYGNEVLLNKEYFNVKKWGDFGDFGFDEDALDWGFWLSTAKEQAAAENEVKWRR